MDYLSAIILGFVQGVTEFLPISSSGHLIIVRDVFGISGEHGLSFDAVLQLATAIAILAYFWRDFAKLLETALKVLFSASFALWRIFSSASDSSVDTGSSGRWMMPTFLPGERMLLFALVLGTIPAVIAGLLVEEYMETVFRSTTLVACTLIVGSILMAVAEYLGRGTSTLTVAKGFWIGCFQTLALVPGISRSGATISGGLFLGLTREEAARFGFLLAFPLLFGSGMKKLLDLFETGAIGDVGPALAVSTITAFLVGIAVIHYLLKYLKRNSLAPFIAYRIVLAILLLLFLPK